MKLYYSQQVRKGGIIKNIQSTTKGGKSIMRIKYICSLFVIIIICILSFLIGCGGGTDTATGSLSQEEVEAIASQLVGGAVSGMGNPSAAPGAQSAPATACTTYPINISANVHADCPVGGYINVTGGATGSINTCGPTYIAISLTETIHDCTCVSDGVTINGDPYISAVATFTFLDGLPATRQDIHISGGIKWGTTPAESCQIDLQTNFDYFSGTSETTGTICGRSVHIDTAVIK